MMKIFKEFSIFAASTYKNFSSILNDHARMNEVDNQIISLSSCAFGRSFRNIAMKISEARLFPTADTYCMLANKALEMLASGENEADVLYYFDNLLIKEFGRNK